MPFANPNVSISGETALALEIAQAISASGISLLGAPELLYDNSEPTPVGTPGLMGATVSDSWIGTTPATAITDLNLNVGLPLGNIVERVYYTEGEYPSITNQPLAAIVAAGAKVQLCLKPLRTGLTTSSIANSEKTNILNTISMLNNNNVTFDIVIWTEGNLHIGSDFTTTAQYISYFQLYAPTIRGAGVKVIYNPGSYNATTAISCYPGDSYCDVISPDYYGTDSKNGITLAAIAVLATRAVPPKPFGISECNAVSAGTDTITTAQWDTYVDTNIIEFMTSLLQAGYNTWDIIWFFGLAVQNSPNNQINSSSDFKVALINTAYNDLSSGPPGGTGIVVNGGATKSIPPINPTPGGGYAVANGISYDITLNFIADTAGSTEPFVTVQQSWFNVDAPGAVPVAQKRWHVPIGTTGTVGTFTTGIGQQYGQYEQIKIVNNDTVPVIVTMQQNSNSRLDSRPDDWYWDAVASVDVPGFTEANSGPSFSNSLVSVNGKSIAAGSTVSYLISMFSGEVTVSVSTGGTSPLQFLLVPQPVNVMGGGAVYDETTTADQRNIFLPRAPCLLSIINPSGSSINAYVQVIPRD